MNLFTLYRATRKQWLRGLVFAQQEVYYAVAAKTKGAEKVKPFEDIPEVKGLPLIGTLLDYTPLKGFKVEYMQRHFQKRHAQYGDIYKEKLPDKGGEYTVTIRTKEDTETMFRSDGPMPERGTVECIHQLKTRFGVTDSIINLNGPEWQRMRNAINPLLLKMKPMWQYIDMQREVSREFVKFMGENLDEKLEVPDFQNALHAWAFEVSGVALLNTRLRAYTANDETAIRVFRNNNMLLNFMIGGTMNPAVTKFQQRRRLQNAVEVYKDHMARVKEIISNSMKNKDENNPTIIEQLMANETLTDDLAINPEVCEKLRKEILDLPADIDGRTLDAMQYMNAFIKEASRLYPFSHVFGRIYSEDKVFSGYRVPAGVTVVNTSNVVNHRDQEYFSEPDKFLPERWYAKDKSNDTRFNLVGTFGMGARSCPGRRLAMQEIRLLLIELLPKYELEYHYKPLVSIFRLTGAPSEKPQFKFIQRGKE